MADFFIGGTATKASVTNEKNKLLTATRHLSAEL
jgi:hypothetical protein